jgi:hypothetical protein
MLWLLLFYLQAIMSNEVILSSGLQDWNHSQLVRQHNIYSTYAGLQILTTSSILVYNLDKKGNLDTYKTNDPNTTAEGFQLSMKQLGLKALPCLFCDATSGFCPNLNERLENLYNNQANFINTTLDEISKYNWDGFTVDFEPDTNIDWGKLTTFLIAWSVALNNVNKPLYVWYGLGTSYDESIYTAVNIKILSMDTYVDSYDRFVAAASDTLIRMSNFTELGVGLLTSERLSEDDMLRVVKWCFVARVMTLSFWSDTIPGCAYEALYEFLHSS